MKKISLIGAGNIGTILAYDISRKNLGDIVLIDKVDGLAEGKCLDLSQSLAVDGIDISIKGSTDISNIEDSDAIIITAGIPRKPGMSRDDLIETNFKVMESSDFLSSNKSLTSVSPRRTSSRINLVFFSICLIAFRMSPFFS